MQERVKKPKKAVNLSIDAELLAEAKAAGTNLSAVLERALTSALKEKRWQQWREANKGATSSMNDYIEKSGIPLKKFRTW